MSKPRNCVCRFVQRGSFGAGLILLGLALTGCEGKPVAESTGPIPAPPRSDLVGCNPVLPA
jgi:hypothetical protein